MIRGYIVRTTDKYDNIKDLYKDSPLGRRLSDIEYNKYVRDNWYKFIIENLKPHYIKNFDSHIMTWEKGSIIFLPEIPNDNSDTR